MYFYIKGEIVNINPKYIVLENSRIAYLINVANPYLYKLNAEYTIYIHQYIKDDINDLYGFLSNKERELFIRLLSVSGIGPKSALSILAIADVDKVNMAIENEDAKYLEKFPGIGPKASKQIILDLKGKLGRMDDTKNNKLDDVMQALISLGYNRKDTIKVLEKIDLNDDESIIIKNALRLLSK